MPYNGYSIKPGMTSSSPEWPTPYETTGKRNGVGKKPRAIDLFCGCGGLSLGLELAGFEVLGAVDIDSLAVDTYAANHPTVKIWKTDIRKLTVPQVMRDLSLRKGELDVLAGCPPCQGFSTMRTLNGAVATDDNRNDLVLTVVKFVRGLRPKAVMLENVAGLAEDARFTTFRGELEKLGYVVNWGILNAKDYGVPQRRRRLVLLAGLGKKIDFGAIAPPTPTVRDTIGQLPPAGTSGDPPHDIQERRSERIRRLIAGVPHDGGSRKDLPTEFQLECHKKCNGFKDVYGRMAWDEASPTITGGCFNPSKGRFLHPDQDRAITLREAALLQTFPQDYRFPNCSNKASVALLIGNALPPEFVRRHALKIVDFLRDFHASAKLS
jgi:DNA (cytosine-5)-methyltransferase 1